jgi:hypothetical protein
VAGSEVFGSSCGGGDLEGEGEQTKDPGTKGSTEVAKHGDGGGVRC